MQQILLKLHSKNAQVPKRCSEGAAGFDLYSAQCLIVPPMQQKVVSTDISIVIPEGYYGRVAGRSGLASQKGILIGGGVIDSDYRGIVGVIIFNISTADFVVSCGDRIAQLIITPYWAPQFNIIDILPHTNRNCDGFGSSGGYLLHSTNQQPDVGENNKL